MVFKTPHTVPLNVSLFPVTSEESRRQTNVLRHSRVRTPPLSPSTFCSTLPYVTLCGEETIAREKNKTTNDRTLNKSKIPTKKKKKKPHTEDGAVMWQRLQSSAAVSASGTQCVSVLYRMHACAPVLYHTNNTLYKNQMCPHKALCGKQNTSKKKCFKAGTQTKWDEQLVKKKKTTENPNCTFKETFTGTKQPFL